MKRTDGVREIRKLDVFEVSVTPAPVNADTRVLSTKALDHEYADVRRESYEHMYKLLTADIAGSKALDRKSTEPVRIASFEC